MRAWTTSGLKSLALLGLFCACTLPATAFAGVQFTEVMYDAPGADTGREWIEVTNTGSDAVDISGYKLSEGGVNHAVTLVSGIATLGAGESAIVAANTQKFLADYPSYSGALFKSAFSLANSSGGFVLKDKTLGTLDSMSYSSGMGANGDGNSLHVSGGSWVPGAPNPGSSAITKAIVKVVPAPVIKEPKASAAKKTTAKKSASSTSYSNSFNVQPRASSAAAVGLAPLIPNIPSWWLYALSLVALIMLGVGAVLYVGTAPAMVETSVGVEEFELE